jgi:hypothetical protein
MAQRKSGANQLLKLIGAAILNSRDIKRRAAAPADEVGRSPTRRRDRFMGARAWMRLLVLALPIAAAVGGWFILTQQPDHPLSGRNYRQIRAGMTRGEVEAILGGPEGVVGQGPEQPSFVALVEQEGPVDALGALEGKPAVWFSDQGQIVVTFDSWELSGRVVGKQLYRRTARQ